MASSEARQWKIASLQAKDEDSSAERDNFRDGKKGMLSKTDGLLIVDNASY